MHDLRTSTALRQLADLGHQPDPPRWSWAIARLEPTGRLVLPREARVALDVRSRERNTVRGICHRVALVLQTGGAGAVMVVDGRSRLLVPTWLRTGTAAAVIVGTRHDVPIVVVAPTTTLDTLGDLLSGERR
ncbi:MAG: hypothetical protein QOD38_257 [Acidimicrobiaceae bacterium]|jgi:hypothetical protein